MGKDGTWAAAPGRLHRPRYPYDSICYRNSYCTDSLVAHCLSLATPVPYVICPPPLMLRRCCTAQLTCSRGTAGQRMPSEPYGATQAAGTGSVSRVMAPRWCNKVSKDPAMRYKPTDGGSADCEGLSHAGWKASCGCFTPMQTSATVPLGGPPHLLRRPIRWCWCAEAPACAQALPWRRAQ